jgi:hypothetical protein
LSPVPGLSSSGVLPWGLSPLPGLSNSLFTGDNPQG